MDIYVINLDRSSERLAHIRHVFSTIGLDFIRVAAVDGYALSDEEFAHLTQKKHWRYTTTRGELGCLLSHRHCLQLAMTSQAPYSAIFEDDAVLSAKIVPLLQNWHWIKLGTDMVKLDTGGNPCVTAPPYQQLDDGYKLMRLLSKHYNTTGYIVSKQAAARLYEITERADAPIDEIYFNPACGVLNKFNIQQMIPAPVTQVGLPSIIRQPRALTGERKRRLPLPQKLRREIRRANEKWFAPLWLALITRRCRWGKVDFS